MPRKNSAPRTIDPLLEPVRLGRAAEPSATAVVLRPLGYLAITIVWVLLLVLVVAVCVIALPAALQATTADGGLQAYPGFHRSDTWLAPVAILMVMVVLGPIAYFLILASVGSALAALTLFVRSVRPSYRHERLSMSIRAAGDEAIGPASTAATGVALSLLPVRLTRWTKLVLMLQFNGWILNGSTFIIGSVWGALYIFTIGWVLWPATGFAVGVCTAVSLILGVVLLWLVWHRRRTFAEVMPGVLRDTVYRWSWPNTRPAASRNTRTQSSVAKSNR